MKIKWLHGMVLKGIPPGIPTELRERFKELLRIRTCIPDGCGYQQPNHLDSKCAVCRLPMGKDTHDA